MSEWRAGQKRNLAPGADHWPAIRWDKEAKRYYFTQYLYTFEQFSEFKGKQSWVRLATEFPPIRLPLEQEK